MAFNPRSKAAPEIPPSRKTESPSRIDIFSSPNKTKDPSLRSSAISSRDKMVPMSITTTRDDAIVLYGSETQPVSRAERILVSSISHQGMCFSGWDQVQFCSEFQSELFKDDN